MMDFERLLDKAVGGDDGAGRTTSGVVVIAADREGKILYSKAAGSASVDPKTAKPMKLDTVCFLASMTKLVTTIAAMQCVERGLISLDDDISEVLPEWKDAEILEGFEEESGKPILRKASNKITLKHFLTHSSGVGYDLMEPSLQRIRGYRGEEPKSLSSSVKEGYFLPLGFEPGEGWTYGAGLDWAGKVVSAHRVGYVEGRESANTPSPKIERLNGDISLGEYFQKYIFDPLGVTSTTFDLTTRPDLTPRLATIGTHTPTGDLVAIPAPMIPSPPIDHCGGMGLYSTAEDYIKILIAVLTKDPRILKPKSVEHMFTPQLKDNGKHLMERLEDPVWQNILVKNLPPGTKATYGLGGMLNLEGTPTGRKPGAMQWGGLPNLFWWIDPETGVCGTVFAQLIPPANEKVVKLFVEFEKSVYGMLGDRRVGEGEDLS